MSDSVSSCISSLKYGCRGKNVSVRVKYSVLSLDICKILYRDGWISSYNIMSSDVIKGVGIIVYFKFFDNKKVLSDIKLFSTPSRST